MLAFITIHKNSHRNHQHPQQRIQKKHAEQISNNHNDKITHTQKNKSQDRHMLMTTLIAATCFAFSPTAKARYNSQDPKADPLYHTDQKLMQHQDMK